MLTSGTCGLLSCKGTPQQQHRGLILEHGVFCSRTRRAINENFGKLLVFLLGPPDGEEDIPNLGSRESAASLLGILGGGVREAG
jgi:hypothetical protein